MNKFERAEIKQIILTQIEQLTKKRLTEVQPHPAQTSRDMLRLERLETTLRRIDADNFGECFKCENPIAMSRLRITPESIICTTCLEEN
jgi:RNA polymerase-binding transcription factor DksA